MNQKAKQSHQRGCNSVVECQLPKLNVAGSNPVTRFQVSNPIQAHSPASGQGRRLAAFAHRSWSTRCSGCTAPPPDARHAGPQAEVWILQQLGSLAKAAAVERTQFHTALPQPHELVSSDLTGLGTEAVMALIETMGMLLRRVESDQGPICLAEAALSQA